MRFSELPNRINIWDFVDEKGGMVQNYTEKGGVMVAMPNVLEDELAIVALMRKHGFTVKNQPYEITYFPICTDTVPDSARHMGPEGISPSYYLYYHFTAAE